MRSLNHCSVENIRSMVFNADFPSSLLYSKYRLVFLVLYARYQKYTKPKFDTLMIHTMYTIELFL